MSRVCSICGKGPMSGNQVSHSHIKTRKSWGVNVQKVCSSRPTSATRDSSRGRLRLRGCSSSGWVR
ncbi:MAG: 50S ribosomal protein L28 [Clostridia bacterium]|nr:50S ribosomal protein L28 [Clostridia bacterium]